MQNPQNLLRSSFFPSLILCLLQEDVPEEFASLILNFISRNRIGPHGVEVSIFPLIKLFEIDLFLRSLIYDNCIEDI